MKTKTEKGILHSRNRHQGHYDFDRLREASPELNQFIALNHHRIETIDFANPKAVKALNRALLKHYYGIESWDIPDQYLCPPIPGRADYIHHLADLIHEQKTPSEPIRVLDIGVGANCVYPIIGHCEYGWNFVGADIDAGALASAKRIIDSNPVLKKGIELRLQPSSGIYRGIIRPDEHFDLTLCNPPFHASAEEADEVNRRKWRNLGKAAVANFGGQSNELWCPGGEAAFVRQMIEESVDFSKQVLWFTSFVSKEASLAPLYETLKRVRAKEVRTVSMAQGQKKSRFIAWSFQR